MSAAKGVSDKNGQDENQSLAKAILVCTAVSNNIFSKSSWPDLNEPPAYPNICINIFLFPFYSPELVRTHLCFIKPAITWPSSSLRPFHTSKFTNSGI